jgi:hypothetical protein
MIDQEKLVIQQIKNNCNSSTRALLSECYSYFEDQTLIISCPNQVVGERLARRFYSFARRAAAYKAKMISIRVNESNILTMPISVALGRGG